MMKVDELRKRWLNQNNSIFFEVLFLPEGDMNVTPCSIKTLKRLYDISGIEVGQNLNFLISGLQIHVQVLITPWVVVAILSVQLSLLLRIGKPFQPMVRISSNMSLNLFESLSLWSYKE